MNKMVLVLTAGLALTGCSTNQQTGALVGGAAGAAIGGVATRNVGGAVVGGAVGALAGAAIGSTYDRTCTYRDPRTGAYYQARCR